MNKQTFRIKFLNFFFFMKNNIHILILIHLTFNYNKITKEDIQY